MSEVGRGGVVGRALNLGDPVASPRRQGQTPNCTQSIAWCVKSRAHTHTHSHTLELGAEWNTCLECEWREQEKLSGSSETLPRAIQTRQGALLQARGFPECKSEGERSH